MDLIEENEKLRAALRAATKASSAAEVKLIVDDALSQQAEPAPAQDEQPVVFWVLFDAAGPEHFIKKDVTDGTLAFFDSEYEAKRAKRRHPGTDYKRVEYYRAPVAQPEQSGIVDGLVSALERLAAAPGCGCSFPCRCGGEEWTRAELEGRMDLAGEALAVYRAALSAQGGEK